MSEHIGSNGQEPYGSALAAKEDFLVALFSSVSHALAAERRLKKAPVPHKLIPVPKKISSNCGICIRFLPVHERQFKDALHPGTTDYTIQKL